MSISLTVAGHEEITRNMHAAGEAVKRAVAGAKYAVGLYMGARIFENSPVRTGAMQESIGVSEEHVEQVAPYTVFVDFRVGHVTQTFHMEVGNALEEAGKVGNRLLRTGGGPESVPNPHGFPEQGVFTPRSTFKVGGFK